VTSLAAVQPGDLVLVNDHRLRRDFRACASLGAPMISVATVGRCHSQFQAQSGYAFPGFSGEHVIASRRDRRARPGTGGPISAVCGRRLTAGRG